MPFSFTNKSAGDLIRSQDWNAAMAAIVALYDKLNGTTGHRHTGGPEDGPLISSAALQDLAVLTQKLADLAVTTQKIADLSVTNQKLANTSVDGSKIANNSVAAAHIIAGAVDNTKLATNAVANAQIQNGAVTNAKMAANSIGSSQLMDLSVSVNKIVDGSVTTPKIADGQVTLLKMAAGVIPEIKIAVSNYVSNGQTIAIPTGYVASECIFVAVSAYYSHYSSAFTVVEYHDAWVTVSAGVATVTVLAASGASYFPHVITFAKKGGW